MALGNTAPLTTWAPLILACALGCATGTQGDGVLPGPGQGGSDDMGGTAGTPDQAGSAGMTDQTSAGTFSSGGMEGVAGTSSGGTFTAAGTFSTAGFTAAGTFTASGTGGMAGGGMPSGGTGGKGAAGGGSSGAAGKGGSGGSGGSAAGAGGSGGGGKCTSVKLAPVTATDAGNFEYAPSQAIDGDVKTRWSSEHLVDTGYLQLDMGKSVLVNHVNIVWETAYATDYKLQVADAAAGPYTDLYENKAGMGVTEDMAAPPIVPHAGRYFRMQGVSRKTNYGYSIWEISVYGDTDPTCK